MPGHRTELLLTMHTAMRDVLGPSQWWPGETPFEIALGAILTQNTNWENVQRALDNLRSENLVNASALQALEPEEMAARIRPAGYYRLKTKRIKNFLAFLAAEADLDLSALQNWPTATLRNKLLAVNGIGPETADSILLYALHKPTFVVDAYTARIFNRHGLIPDEISYNELQDFFMTALPQDTALFNEYHAQLVRIGKQWCKKRRPTCQDCPLQPFLPT
ncbi:MAG: endonuclease III domain-containing protein [Thermodesulfobacteriota bacterium]